MKEVEIEVNGEKKKIQFNDDLPIGEINDVLKRTVRYSPQGQPQPDIEEYVVQILYRAIKDESFKTEPSVLRKLDRKTWKQLSDLVAEHYPMVDFLLDLQIVFFGKNRVSLQNTTG